MRGVNGLDDGVYVIRVSCGDARSYKVISLTNNSVVVKSSNKNSIAWIISTVDGKPYDNKTLKFYDDFTGKIVNTNTDKDGVAMYDGVTSYVFSDDLGVFSSSRFSNNINTREINYDVGSQKLFAYIFTDRTIYRPGDEINYKVFAREKSGFTTVPATEKLTLNFTGGSALPTQTLALDEFGTASGTITLPKDAKVGDYRLTIGGPNENSIYANSLSVQVEAYKIHNYEVTVDTGSRELYRTADTITLNVDAKYYFGQPVVDGNVEVNLYVRDSYNYLDQLKTKSADYDSYDYYTRYYYDPGYSAYSSIKLATVTGKLDGNGHVVLNVPYNVPDAQAYGNGKTLSAEVKVSDPLGDYEYHTYYKTMSPKGGNIGGKFDDTNGNIQLLYLNDWMLRLGKILRLIFTKNNWTESVVKEMNGVSYWNYKNSKELVKSMIATTDGSGKFESNLELDA